MADREVGLEGNNVVLHQVAEGVVRWVVQGLCEEGSETIRVGVVIGNVKVASSPRAVSQNQSIFIVAVIIERVALFNMLNFIILLFHKSLYS